MFLRNSRAKPFCGPVSKQSSLQRAPLPRWNRAHPNRSAGLFGLRRLQLLAARGRAPSAVSSVSGILEPVGLVEVIEPAPIPLGMRHIARLLQHCISPHRESVTKFSSFGNSRRNSSTTCLDQEAAERNSAETALGIGDRIEHCGGGPLDRQLLGGPAASSGAIASGNRFRQCHPSNENQRLVDQGLMNNASQARRRDRCGRPVSSQSRIACTASYADDFFPECSPAFRPSLPGAATRKSPVEP